MLSNDYINGDELYHTGRKGMRWGQHIYGRDGNLNRRGRRQFKKVAKNPKKIKEQTEQAKKALKSAYKDALKDYKDCKKLAKSPLNNRESRERYLHWAKEFVEDSKLYKKALKDIDTGKIKAGKDFIINVYRNPTYYKMYNKDQAEIYFKNRDNEYNTSQGGIML